MSKVSLLKSYYLAFKGPLSSKLRATPNRSTQLKNKLKQKYRQWFSCNEKKSFG